MTVSLTLHFAGELPALPRMGLFRQLGQALRRMAQWRLLLAWWLALALPTLLVALPLWRALAGPLDHSLLGPRLAQGLDLTLLAELRAGLTGPQQVLAPATLGLAGLLWTLLATPWLTGMAGAAARQPVPLHWNALLRAGLADYGRMGRLLVWSLFLLGLAVVLGTLLDGLVERHAAHSVLAADARFWRRLAQGFTWGLLFLLQASVEAGRAGLVLQPRRRSAVLAWWQALPTLWRNRGRGMVLFLALSLLMALCLAGTALLRWSVPGGLPLALPVGQLGILALAWGRCARLAALVDAGRMAR